MGAMAFCSDRDQEHRAHGTLGTPLPRCVKTDSGIAGMTNEDLFRPPPGVEVRHVVPWNPADGWLVAAGGPLRLALLHGNGHNSVFAHGGARHG